MTHSLNENRTYYGVELYRNSKDAKQWLKENFGFEGKRYFIHGNTVYFEKSKDQLMFVLKWS
jgi:hypothetical protein